MSKHTPGPWIISEHEMGTFVRCAEDYIISGPINKRPGHKANARLIAAAPDLLFQLQAAANYIDALGGDSKSYRAALSKAKGEMT